MPNENGNKEVLEAIQVLATHVDERFDEVKSEFGEVRQEIRGLREDMKFGFTTLNYKTERIAEKLQEKQVFSKEDVEEIVKLDPLRGEA